MDENEFAAKYPEQYDRDRFNILRVMIKKKHPTMSEEDFVKHMDESFAEYLSN